MLLEYMEGQYETDVYDDGRASFGVKTLTLRITMSTIMSPRMTASFTPSLLLMFSMSLG